MFAIALRSLLNRWFSVMLVVLAIGLGVALYLGIERIRQRAKNSFEASINGVDLIVGSRGGDVQILLYSVFNIGNATNNIQASSLETIAQDRRVSWVVPISLGDSHRGYRVVGTTDAFFERVRTGRGQPLRFAHGEGLEVVFGAVLGSQVARDLGYELGQSMVVSHGLVSAGTAEHDQMPFYVSAILEPTGTPIDSNVYVSLEGIEAIHVDWRNGAKIPGRNTSAEELAGLDLSPKTLTAAFFGIEDRLRVFQVQRSINEFSAEPLSAILPGIALSNLWGVMDSADVAFAVLGLSAFVVSVLGLVALLNLSLAQRRREMAIYRALGANALQVAALLVIEAMIIGLSAIVLGVLLSLGLEFAASWFARNVSGVSLLFAPYGLREGLSLLILVAATTLSGLIPAIRLYLSSLSSTLQVTE